MRPEVLQAVGDSVCYMPATAGVSSCMGAHTLQTRPLASRHVQAFPQNKGQMPAESGQQHRDRPYEQEPCSHHISSGLD